MAPSTTSALHPIVIPAAQVPPHFTTLGAGLLHNTYARETVSTLRGLLLSRLPLLQNNDKPKPWWRAQCLLYAIDAPEKRTVPELRARLELALLKGELEVPGTMAELERRENGKFRKLNAQVRDAMGMGRRAAPKDPLKVVKSAGKVVKSQSPNETRVTAAGGVSTTVNLTINLQSTAAQSKAAGKRRAPAKPRARKAASGAGTQQKRQTAAAGMSGSTYFGSAMEPGVKPKKQAARRGGGAPKTTSRAAPAKAPSAPRLKQTARCSTRGGASARGRSTPKVKEEVQPPAYSQWDEDGDESMADYYLSDTSRHAETGYEGHYDENGYSDHDEEGCPVHGKERYSDQDDEHSGHGGDEHSNYDEGYTDQYGGYENDVYGNFTY